MNHEVRQTIKTSSVTTIFQKKISNNKKNIKRERAFIVDNRIYVVHKNEL